MLAEEHGGRRQLRDLMARGLPERLALRRAEHVAAAATTRPVLDELVERLDRRQMTTASRMAGLGTPLCAPPEQLAGAQARPADPGWAAPRSCASCGSGAAPARRCAPPAWRGARSARRPLASAERSAPRARGAQRRPFHVPAHRSPQPRRAPCPRASRRRGEGLLMFPRPSPPQWPWVDQLNAYISCGALRRT